MIADRVSAETLFEVQLKVLLIDEQWGKPRRSSRENVDSWISKTDCSRTRLRVCLEYAFVPSILKSDSAKATRKD